MFKENDIAHLKNILWTIEKIEKSRKLVANYEDLKNNYLVYDSLITELMVIGEAAHNISEDLKLKNEHVNWKGMYGLRNLIAHHYFKIDEKIIWNIIDKNIPKDKMHIERIYTNLTEKK
jgi:uncharacterized protein with HEPN domain